MQPNELLPALLESLSVYDDPEDLGEVTIL